MVERRWPTWKGLAIFGELNSTTIFLISSSNRALLFHFFEPLGLQRRMLFQSSDIFASSHLHRVEVKTSDTKEGEFRLKGKTPQKFSFKQFTITWDIASMSLGRTKPPQCHLLQEKAEISAKTINLFPLWSCVLEPTCINCERACEEEEGRGSAELWATRLTCVLAKEICKTKLQVEQMHNYINRSNIY